LSNNNKQFHGDRPPYSRMCASLVTHTVYSTVVSDPHVLKPRQYINIIAFLFTQTIQTQLNNVNSLSTTVSTVTSKSS